MTDNARLVPFPDRDSAPWWAALARHELTQQRCGNCGRWRWPPRAMCGECGSFDWSWEPITDRGTVVSWITTHHAFLPGFQAPYHTVFVRLELTEGSDQDDVVMPGTWFGDEPPAVGMTVQAHFDDIPVAGDEPVTLLGWEPARS
jgi:uncharacterized OB-fold protein